MKIFISYSHENPDALEKLLSPYLRQLQIDKLIDEAWSDIKLDGGDDWRDKIRQAMQDCQLGLFLLTPDFFASEFIRSEELTLLLQRHKQQHLTLYPILVQECNITDERLNALQILPDKTNAIYAENESNEQNRRWLQVQSAIKSKSTEYRKNQNHSISISGPPYPLPGRSFEPDQADRFFGREDLAQTLAERLRNLQFLMIEGNSGSGKSSLVKAGIIPVIEKAAGEGKCVWLITTPGEVRSSPIDGLAQAFAAKMSSQWDFTRVRNCLLASIAEAPACAETSASDSLQQLAESCRKVGANSTGRDVTHLLLLVDQFEELVTEDYSAEDIPLKFATLLDKFADLEAVRVIVTARQDYSAAYTAIEPINRRINAPGGRYSLLELDNSHYRNIIERPASLAGFTFEGPTGDHNSGVVDRLIADTQQRDDAAGSLPLLAFALGQLQRPFESAFDSGQPPKLEERVFLHAHYDAFGGLQGAVDQQAEEALETVQNGEKILARLVPQLVRVSRSGRYARRYLPKSSIASNTEKKMLIEALVNNRIMIAEGDYYAVAHDFVLTAWPRLKQLIDKTREALAVRDNFVHDARSWVRAGKPESMLWKHERLEPLYQALQQLDIAQDSFDDNEQEFLRPEAQRLVAQIADDNLSPMQRDEIGSRLGQIGDPRPGISLQDDGLPDIDWCNVKAAENEPDVIIEKTDRRYAASDFKIARYPVTRLQFASFINHPEGYQQPQWWNEATPKDSRTRHSATHATAINRPNYPQAEVCWWEADAFCRWLTQRQRTDGSLAESESIDLPTEWQWQQAARRRRSNPSVGGEWYEWPWAGDFHADRANTQKTGLGSACAVGLFTQGQSTCGALDMAGNVFEWCCNTVDIDINDIDSETPRVIRGGSFYNTQDNARVAFRNWYRPDGRLSNIGFRLCLSSPISGC